MKKNILLFFITALTLISCNQSNEKNTLNQLIKESLKSNKNIERVFLNLKFGMSKTEFENELKELNQSRKIKPDYSGYSYEFIDNKNLSGINWLIRPEFHNDTIIGIELYSFKNFWKNNYNSVDETYKEIISEYERTYGKPSYSKSEFENYWLKDNLLISISKSKSNDLGGKVYIKYDDERKESKIDLTKCIFDEYGNSMDKWYFDLKEKNKPINTDL